MTSQRLLCAGLLALLLTLPLAPAQAQPSLATIGQAGSWVLGWFGQLLFWLVGADGQGAPPQPGPLPSPQGPGGSDPETEGGGGFDPQG